MHTISSSASHSSPMHNVQLPDSAAQKPHVVNHSGFFPLAPNPNPLGANYTNPHVAKSLLILTSSHIVTPSSCRDCSYVYAGGKMGGVCSIPLFIQKEGHRRGVFSWMQLLKICKGRERCGLAVCWSRACSMERYATVPYEVCRCI